MKQKALVLLLVACSGSAPSSPQSPTGDADVTASISGADKALVGVAVVLDASNSVGASTYAWDFGDGTRGGSSKLSHVFTKVGDYTVTLHANNATRSATATFAITVSENAMMIPTRTVALNVRVVSQGNAPIDGATIVVGDNSTSTSAGVASIDAPGGVPFAVAVSKAGYAPQLRRITIADSVSNGDLTVVMRTREASQTIDATLGGEIVGKHGALLRLTPGSLVDSKGQAVSGNVQLSLTPIPVTTEPETFPGKFEGINTDGVENLLVSWGATEVAFDQDGERLNLAPGSQAIVDLPMYSTLKPDGTPLALGDVIPAWSLDERTGQWIQEGSGVVVASQLSPTGFAQRIQATHFSWWNCDDFPQGTYKAKAKCMVDTNLDGVYEDLSGTGYCNNAGTNPNAARQASGLLPAFYFDVQIPAGGMELPVPADWLVLFTASALNGLYVGTALVQGPAGGSGETILYLNSVEAPPGPTGSSGPSGASGDSSPTCGNPVDDNGVLPLSQAFTIDPAGQTDRFTLAAEVGKVYVVTVTPFGLGSHVGDFRALA